jgi:hypothetical protein
MINAFVGFSFTLRKYMVQNAKSMWLISVLFSPAVG